MSYTPQTGYKIVERDGRLVIEYDKPSKLSRLRGLKFPKLTFPTESLWKFGRALFINKFNPELDHAGNAIVYANDLRDLVRIDARSDDQYYLTERQQALVGYFVYHNWVKVGAVLFSTIFLKVLHPLLFALLLIAVLLFFILSAILSSEIEVISWQRYFPEDWPAPESDTEGEAAIEPPIRAP